jgi:hypothetical protein
MSGITGKARTPAATNALAASAGAHVSEVRGMQWQRRLQTAAQDVILPHNGSEDLK